MAGIRPASQQSWHARLVASRVRLAFGAPHFRLRSNVAPRAKTQSSDERCAPSALQKCSIMTGCGARIVLRSACTLRPLPLLRFAASAAGGAHLRSTKYYLRFLLSSWHTSPAISARRIMRWCLNRITNKYEKIMHPAKNSAGCYCQTSSSSPRELAFR